MPERQTMGPDIPAWLLRRMPSRWPVHHDRRVQRRLRYSLIGALDYLAVLFVIFCYAAGGVIGWVEPALISAGVAVHVLTVLHAVATGRTLALPDALVAGYQIGTAHAWTLLCLFLLPEIGLLLLGNLLITTGFASLNLTRRHFLATWALLCVATSWVLLALDMQVGLPLSTPVQVWLFLFISGPVFLGRMLLVHAEIARSRVRALAVTSTLRETRQALAESRGALAQLVDHLPVATFVFDVQGRLRLTNRQARALLPHADDAQPGATLPAVAGHFSGLARDGSVLAGIKEQEVRAPDGRRYLASLSPLAAVDGDMPSGTETVLTLSDITAIRSAEVQREQALHFLSHDLRAPLSAAISLLDMVPAARSTEFDMVRANLRHSLSLAEDFVLMARAERVSTHQLRELVMADVATEAADLLQPTAVQQGIHLEVDIQGDTRVMGDWSLLLRAVTNLLSNALAFAPRQGQVRVHCAPSGSDVVLTVRDDGPGFPPEVLQALFSERHRNQSLGKRVGLGLLLVEQVARGHGGAVQARNGVGGGATVAFSLQSVACTQAAANARPKDKLSGVQVMRCA